METTIGRILNYVWFTFSFVLGLPFVSKPDIIWSTSPNIFCGFTARISRVLYRKPAIANVDDIWPEAPIELGFLTHKFWIYISTQIGTHAFDNLNGISTISETISQYYRKKYHKKNVYTIPVGIEHSRLMKIIEIGKNKFPITLGDNAHTKNQEQKNIKIMYSGILGPAYDFELLIDAVCRLNPKFHIKLLIRGTGPQKAYIKDRLKRHQYPKNVILEMKFLSIEELNAKLLSADIFVLPMMEQFISTTALPTKLFEYMAFGKPVLLYGIGEPKMLVENAQCGIVCPNGGSINFSKSIEMMLNSQDKWKSFGQNGQKYILEHFSSQSIVKYVDKMFNDLRIN